MFEHLLEFEETEKGFENLKEAVDIRDRMGGALYYNILEDTCCKIANKLLCMGADRDEINKALGR